MSTKTPICQVLLAAFVFSASTACAQGPKRASSLRDSSIGTQDSVSAARHFVQAFYDWYAPIANANLRYPADWKVLTVANQYLDDGLAVALRSDSTARADAKRTRELLDFDPFLAGQDPCPTSRVTEVRRSGATFLATVLTCARTKNDTDGPRVVARVIPVNGHWRITNIEYGENSDLRGWLCKYANEDARPERRPEKC